jgi:hypothetical protein
MPRVTWHAFRSRQKYLDYRAFSSEIFSGVKQEFVPKVFKEYQDRVAHWKIQPVIIPDIYLDDDGVGIDVVLKGYAAKLWRFISDGVAGHFIQPSKDKVAMASKPGAAGAAGLAGRPGAGGIGIIFSKGHWWPGIQARNWDEAISTKLRPEWVRICENILKRAVRTARREV